MMVIVMAFLERCSNVALVVSIGVFIAFNIGIAQHITKYDDCKCHDQHQTKAPGRIHEEFTYFSLESQHKLWEFRFFLFSFSTYFRQKFGSFSPRNLYSSFYFGLSFSWFFFFKFWKLRKFTLFSSETHTFDFLFRYFFSSGFFFSLSFLFYLKFFLFLLFLQFYSLFLYFQQSLPYFPVFVSMFFLFLLLSVYCTQSKFNYWH